MLNPHEQELALANTLKVRKAFPVAGFQVIPHPQVAGWVQVRYLGGPWQVMSVSQAIAYKRMLRAKLRYSRWCRLHANEFPPSGEIAPATGETE